MKLDTLRSRILLKLSDFRLSIADLFIRLNGDISSTRLRQILEELAWLGIVKKKKQVHPVFKSKVYFYYLTEDLRIKNEVLSKARECLAKNKTIHFYPKWL